MHLRGQATKGPDPEIGLIFQEPRLFPWLTVTQNIVFGASAPRTTRRKSTHCWGKSARPATAGRCRSSSRVARPSAWYWRGLYWAPRVLLLDEPLSAVDAFTRMRLQDLLAQVAPERRLTVLLVTHDIDEALFLSDRIVLMDGRPAPARAGYRVEPARPRARAALVGLRLKAATLDDLHALHAI